MNKAKSVSVFLDRSARKVWSREYDQTWSFLHFDSLDAIREERYHGTAWDLKCPGAWAVYMEFLDNGIPTGLYQVKFGAVTVTPILDEETA